MIKNVLYMKKSDKSMLYLDIETNGLQIHKDTQVFCVCTSKGEFVNNYENLQSLINNADIIVGHNILSFDAPMLRAVLDLTIPNDKLFDTLLVSRLFEPDRKDGHSLKAWGIKLGQHKTEFTDFSQFSDDMLKYCRNDVKVTELVYNKLMSEKERYKALDKSIEIEHKFAVLINEQIKNGFSFNVEKANTLYSILQKEYEELYEVVLTELPKKRLDSECYRKAKLEGRLLTETNETFSFADKKGKVIIKEIKYEIGNPTSRRQIAQYLIDEYKWVPTIFTETNLPKVSESILSTLPYDFAKKAARLFRIQKQLGMLNDGDNSWLKLVTSEGKLHGNVITNGTNTGRCSHNKPNVAQVDKKDLRMRELFEPKKGWKLVGIDAASLELRILAHYLHRYDGGLFAEEVTKGDIHSYNQNIMQLNERNSAKTAIYALVYGAGNEKLGKIVAEDAHESIENSNKLKHKGIVLRENIEENFLGYKELLKDVDYAYQGRGFLIGLDGRPLHPRSDYSALNLLIQSAGAIIMKQALINSAKILIDNEYVLGVHYNYVANIHDEIQIEAEPSIIEEVGKCVVQAIRKTKEDFNLRCDMDGEYKIGPNWAATH